MKNQNLQYTMVFVSLMLTLTSSMAHVYRMRISENESQEKGHASNCGKSTFGLTWSPDVIRPDDNIVVYLNYTAPYDCSSGIVNASVYFRGDTDPFVAYVNPFVCADLHDYFPCPVKKGEYVTKRVPISSLRSLSSYPGDYTLVAEVRNEKGQQMVCAKADVTVEV